MKKLVGLLLIILFLLTGCGKKEEVGSTDSPSLAVTKLDDSKDFVYFEKVKEINEDYTLQYAFINLNSESVSNINLELKNFVNSSFKNMVFTDELFIQGNVISYEYFVGEQYITLIQNYDYYVNATEKEPNSFTYVVNKNTGEILSNKEILESVSMQEKDLYSFVLKYEGLEDNLYTVSILKNNGYQLYFDDIEHLVLRYYDIHDDGVEKRELLIQ